MCNHLKFRFKKLIEKNVFCEGIFICILLEFQEKVIDFLVVHYLEIGMYQLHMVIMIVLEFEA